MSVDIDKELSEQEPGRVRLMTITEDGIYCDIDGGQVRLTDEQSETLASLLSEIDEDYKAIPDDLKDLAKIGFRYGKTDGESWYPPDRNPI